MANRARRKQELHPQTSNDDVVPQPLLVISEAEDSFNHDEEGEGLVMDVTDEGQSIDDQFVVLNDEEVVTETCFFEQQPDGTYTYMIHGVDGEVQLVAEEVEEVAAVEEVADFDTAPAVDCELKAVNSAVDNYYKTKRTIQKNYTPSKPYAPHREAAPLHRPLGGKKIAWKSSQPTSSSRMPNIMSRSSPHKTSYIKHRAGSPRSVVAEIDDYTDEEEEGDEEVDENEEQEQVGSEEYDSIRPRSSFKPKKRGYAHRLQWSPDDMKVALDAVQIHRMTIRGAAKKFGVPYSTLKDRVNGRVLHGAKPGVKTTLSPEEETELEDCINRIKDSGFQMHCIDIREKARELLLLNGGNHTRYGIQNRQIIPGHNWLAGFFKRHKGIEIKRSVKPNGTPSVVKQKQILKSFFDVAEKTYHGATVSALSRRLFTLREVALTSHNGAKVLVAANADGNFLPPFVVFRNSEGKVSYPDKLHSLCPDGRFYASPTGCVTADILLAWFREHLLPALRQVKRSSQQPAVLMMTQPIANISVRLVKMAEGERVQLICIPAAISHLIQPFNDSMTISLDANIMQRASKLLAETGEVGSSQQSLALVLFKVWTTDLPVEALRNNFSSNGLLPLNPRAISMDRIMSTASLNQPYDEASSSPHDDRAEEDDSSKHGGLHLLSVSAQYYDTVGASRGASFHSAGRENVVNNYNPEVYNERYAGGTHRVTAGLRSSSSRYIQEQDEEEEEEENEESYSTSYSRDYSSRKRRHVRHGSPSSSNKTNSTDSSPEKRSYTEKCFPKSSFTDNNPAKKFALSNDSYRRRMPEVLASRPTDHTTRHGADKVGGVSPKKSGVGGCSRTRPTSYEPRTYAEIRSDLAATRNPDVLNSAINSIMSGSGDQSAFGEHHSWMNASSDGVALEVEEVGEEMVEEQMVFYEDGGEYATEVEGYEQGGVLYKVEVNSQADAEETFDQVAYDENAELYEEQQEEQNTNHDEGDILNAALPVATSPPAISWEQLRAQFDPNEEIQIVTTTTVNGKPVKNVRKTTLNELGRQGEINSVEFEVEVEGETGGEIKGEVVDAVDDYCENVIEEVRVGVSVK